MWCADGECPAARRLQPLLAVDLGQVQQPQAGAIALLGVGPVLELPLNCAFRRWRTVDPGMTDSLGAKRRKLWG
jgi:hypothetical protein